MYNYNFEKIFSYWIFVWFLVYFISLKGFKILLPNPFFAVCMALLVNGIELSYTVFNYVRNGEKDTNYMYNTFLYEVKLIVEDLNVCLPETSELATTLIQYDCDIDLALDAIEKKLLNQ